MPNWLVTLILNSQVIINLFSSSVHNCMGSSICRNNCRIQQRMGRHQRSYCRHQRSYCRHMGKRPSKTNRRMECIRSTERRQQPRWQQERAVKSSTLLIISIQVIFLNIINSIILIKCLTYQFEHFEGLVV